MHLCYLKNRQQLLHALSLDGDHIAGALLTHALFAYLQAVYSAWVARRVSFGCVLVNLLALLAVVGASRSGE